MIMAHWVLFHLQRNAILSLCPSSQGSKTFLEEGTNDLKNIYDSNGSVSSLDSGMFLWFRDFVLFFFISNKFKTLKEQY